MPASSARRTPSPTVKSIDIKPALAIKGVVAVITMDDIKAAEVKNLSQHPPVAGRNGGKLVMPVRPALAGDKVRHVGEPVAMVLAETYAAAQDGAEAVEVDYEAHDAVTDLREAMKPGAPQVWPEAPGNIAVDWAGLAANPDEMAAKVDAAMKSAAHVAKVSLVHQRINVASMEPRGGTASYDKANDSYLLRVCSQGARAMRDAMAGVMGIPPAKIRVTTEEVGGAFGLKTGPYPEYVAMLVGAKKTGRPVHWMSGRNESFVSDNHARDAVSDVELALDDEGQVPGVPAAPLRQPRRLCRRGRRQHPYRQHDALPARHVRHQADGRAVQVRVHPHHTHRAISRRGPPGGELLPGARGGRGRARHRHRSGPAAQEEPHFQEGHAIQDLDRHHL